MRKLQAWIAATALVIPLALLLAQQGPQSRSSETVARPRKTPTSADAPPETPSGDKVTSKFGKKKQDETPEGLATFRSDVTTVEVDVAVLDNKGNPIPGIPKGNFRILEDGVPQQITTFALDEAPMTVCMVIEFSNLFQSYWTETWYQTLTAAYGFLETLKPDDYVAVVAYDLRPEILSDFSTDKRNALEAMQRLRIAAYSESNLYDALVDTTERMSEIEGRRAVVLIASGMDTFSKLTFDKTRKALQSAGVPIYAVGIGQYLREYYDARGMLGPIARLDFLQADNQMRVFSRETGGMSFFPRFYGEFPSIFQAISQALRVRYLLAYQPSNQAKDGSFRKLKVELVAPDGQPLRVTDQKGKPIKYSLIAKSGYNAPRAVE